MKFVLALAIGFVSIASAEACQNGQTAYFPSNNPDLRQGEAARDVLWTCVNGQFVENGYTAPAPQYRGCVEGDLQVFADYDAPLGEGYENATFVCRNGQYKKVNGSTKAPAKRGGYVCKNGTEIYFDEYVSGSNEIQKVLYICKKGKFVRKH